VTDIESVRGPLDGLVEWWRTEVRERTSDRQVRVWHPEPVVTEIDTDEWIVYHLVSE